MCYIGSMIIDFIKKLFSFVTKTNPQHEDFYIVTITDELVRVEHPTWGSEAILWKEVHTILLINTNEGPWVPDVWLTLVSNNSCCRIPLGAKGYEEVYNIVSKYEGFNFENAIKSMTCTDNAEFLLWTNNNPN